jgi:hypothetical protein
MKIIKTLKMSDRKNDTVQIQERESGYYVQIHHGKRAVPFSDGPYPSLDRAFKRAETLSGIPPIY